MEKDAKVKSNKKAFTIITWVITVFFSFLVIILLVFGIFSIKEGKMVKVLGYSYSVIASPSMEDTIKVGDVILINCNINYDDIEKGDIIVFYNPNENKNIAHRVVDITSSGFVTCGDNNNNLVDSFKVTKEYYIGKVVKYGRLFGLGTLIMNGRFVFFIALFAIFGYFILSEGINIYKIILNKKHEDKMRQIEEEKEKARERLREEIKKEILKELESKK